MSHEGCRTGRLSVLLCTAAFLWACGPATAGPPAPDGLAGPAGEAAWQGEWNALVEAARKEGRVVVRGSAIQELRAELPRVLKDRFGVDVEYIGATSSEFGVQVQKERAAGIYSVDVALVGAAGMYPTVYANNWLDPLLPVLIHPDARDGSKWPNGKLWFMDPEEQYILRLANSVSHSIAINTNYIRRGEIKSWYDLLKPEYRGKIASDDPQAQSAGHALATVMYLKLGEEYVKSLFIEQRPALSRDDRQLADWLARGAYPIVLGLRDDAFERLQAEGFPVVKEPNPPEVPATVSAGFALMGLMNNAPHPNAAKLFVNWIATKEGMEVLSKNARVVPVRSDVDVSSFPQDRIPQPGEVYLDTYEWDFAVNQRLPLSSRVKELLR